MTLTNKIYNDLQSGARLTVSSVFEKYGSNSLSSIVSELNSLGKLVSTITLPGGHKEYFIKSKVKRKFIDLSVIKKVK